MSMLLTVNWREWYRARHQQECFKSGTPFEDYATAVLRRHHVDFLNPAPTGSLGDGGCDGLAEAGAVLYACYGQRPGSDAERELVRKINGDFSRALGQWGTFTTWIFITNAPIGPLATAAITAIQQTHGADSSRPLTILAMTPDDLWSRIVNKLPQTVLDDLFPGAPGTANVELADLAPLLETLDSVGAGESSPGAILPVPPHKMDFNQIPEATRAEFNVGRLYAPSVEKGYRNSSNPGLYDAHAERFRQIYIEARAITTDSGEIVERLYVALFGPNLRMEATRANAAYAVISFFFDACAIFERPTGEVMSSAASH